MTKRRLLVKTGAAILCLSFAFTFFCNVSCETVNTDTQPEAKKEAFAAVDAVEDVSVPEKQENTPEAKITATERELIERVVAAEARGESYEGQKAVASVIYNRCAMWGMSVHDVLLAKAQFAKPYSGEIPQSVRAAVADVFDNGNITHEGITHFHAISCAPYWAESKQFVAMIGAHKFYK